MNTGLITLLLLLVAWDSATVAHGSSGKRSRIDSGKPSIELVVRSYAGDKVRCTDMLIQSMHMFVDSQKYATSFILDDESAADHEWGEVLRHSYNFTVFYEKMPPNDALSVKPFGEYGQHRYGSIGYNRQLYSQFFLDQYSSADIIGLVDCDNLFQTFLTDEIVYDKDDRVRISAVHHNNYYNEPSALKTPIAFGTMETEVMPKFFWRETVRECREYIMKLHNQDDFSKAWKVFSQQNLSPVNIFSQYGAMMSPEKYVFITELDSVGMIGPAYNRPTTQHPIASVVGCCRAFNVNCLPVYQNDTRHVLRYNNANKYAWKDAKHKFIYHTHADVSFVNNTALVWRHYENVKRHLARMPPEQVQFMKGKCSEGIKSMQI